MGRHVAKKRNAGGKREVYTSGLYLILKVQS